MSSQQQQLVNVDASRPSKRQRRHRSSGQSASASSSGLNPAVMNPMMPFMMNPMMAAAAMGGMGHMQSPPVMAPPQAAGGGPGDDGGSSDDDEFEAPAGGHVEPAPADPAVIAQRQAELALQQARAGLFTEPQTVAARDAQRINRNYATVRSLPKVGQSNRQWRLSDCCQVIANCMKSFVLKQFKPHSNCI